MDHLRLVFFMLLRLFIAALWSPAGKGLTSWLLFVMFNCFCHFHMWYPGSGVVFDLCHISYFSYFSTKTYVLDTQKNGLNEHPNHMIKLMGKKIFTFYALKMFTYTNEKPI